MSAGLYRYPIKLVKQVYVRNDYGETVKQDDRVVCCRAEVTHQGGSKDIDNGETWIGYKKTFKVYRHNPTDDFTEVEYQGKRYRILSIEDVPERNQKIIAAELINT